MITDSHSAGIAGEAGLVDIGQAYSVYILRIIKAGWTLALREQGLRADLDELEMTGFLRKGMTTTVNDESRVGGRRVSILVASGTEVWSSAQSTRAVGLTDIAIYLINTFEKYGDHDPHAVIECKRVAGSDAKLCRLYVVNGIDRFIEGRYAERHETAFMVGYLISGNAKAATSGINAHFARKRRESDHLNSCTITDDPWARSSRHSRPDSGMPIDLHHAFLDFSRP